MTEDSIDATVTETGEAIHRIGDVGITETEIADPEAFLSTARGKAWFEDLMRGVYFSAYYRDRGDCLEKKTVQRIANRILEARQAGSDEQIETLLEETLGHGACAEDDYHEQGAAEDHERRIGDLASDIRDHADEEGLDLPELDEDAWQEAVRDRAVEAMYEQDDSSVMDMVDSHERFELIVRMAGDDTIYSNRSWAAWDDLAVDESLQTALARLGHTVGEYRLHSRNRSAGSGLRRGLAKRRPEIASLEQIRSVVVEACSSSFSIVLFAHVRLRDLFDLDLTKPIMLSDCSLASYDSMNGTFYDVGLDHSVELAPGQFVLEAATGYTPDSICGLVLSAYDADLGNVVEALPEAPEDDQDDLPLAA